MKYEPRLFALMFDYTRRLTADVSDADLYKQPAPGMNPAGWLLGHLALSNDFALSIMGEATVCPAEWSQWFGPKSVPLAEGMPRPKKNEFLSMIETGYAKVSAALAKGPAPDKLAAPNPIDFLRGPLPTAGDLLAHLLTTHVATHLGQLSAWRRAAGLKAA